MCELVLKESGLKAKIESLPWNRAYNEALTTPDIMIFTMGRNTEREKLFDWAFPIAPRETWFIKLKSNNKIKGSVLNDFKNYKIGTGPKSDATTQELIKMGFDQTKNLDIYEGENPDPINIQKLFSGRIDIIAGNPISLAYVTKELKLDYTQTENIILISGSGSYWAALSLGTNPDISKKIKETATKLEKSGEFKKILTKYLK